MIAMFEEWRTQVMRIEKEEMPSTGMAFSEAEEQLKHKVTSLLRSK